MPGRDVAIYRLTIKHSFGIFRLVGSDIMLQKCHYPPEKQKNSRLCTAEKPYKGTQETQRWIKTA